jgi:signal transduction histidine kinase/ligand-binding sensor domain-containing protein
MIVCILSPVAHSAYAGASSAGPSGVERGFSVSIWRTKDGLPADRIRHLLRDRAGFLWVATFNGVARFDGVRFRTYNVTNTPGLRNNLINVLFEDRAGRLWLGHDTGHISVYDRGEFRPMPLAREWPGAPVNRIAQTGDGTVWLLNSQGWLLPVRGEQSGPILPGIENRPVASLVTDGAGVLLAASGQRVFSVGAEEPSAMLSLPGRIVPILFSARAGGIWIATSSGVRRWHDHQWIGETIPTAIREQAGTNTWLETSTGVFAVSTFADGLHLLSPDGTGSSVTVRDGLPSNHIVALAEDSEGNLWVGDRGLCRLRPRSVQMVAPPDGWRNRAVQAVVASRDGTLWVATEGAGIYHRIKDDWTRYDQQAGLGNLVAKTLLETSDGRLLAGFSSGGVYRLEGEHFRPIFQHPSFSVISALFQDTTRRIWIGGIKGAFIVEGGSSKPTPVTSPPDFSHITAFAESTGGAVWIGSLGTGLGRYHAGALTVLRQNDGLPSNYIWSLSAARDGTLWIGTYDRGLVRFRNGRFAIIDSSHGLPGNMIGQIVEDQSGAYWLGTNGGIARVTSEELNRCAEGGIARASVQIFDLSEGLTTLGLAGGAQSAACRAPDGSLWFATDNGLAQVDPRQPRPASTAPPVFIEAIRIDGNDATIPPGSGVAAISIAPGSRRVEIDYSALSLGAPHRVRFRYLLEGADKNWTDAATRRTAYYSYLRPGHYRFRVQSAPDDDAHEATEAALSFRVLPHYWETAWFRLLTLGTALLLVGGIVAAILHTRHRRRMEQLERARAVERDRTRIAHDLHDEIGSGLTQLSILTHAALAANAPPEKVASRLREIEGATTEMTEAIDEIVWAVNPRHDSLESLVSYLERSVQEFANRASLQCHFDIPLNLGRLEVTAEYRHELYLAIREGLHNVAKHSGASAVWFVVRRQHDEFFFCVEDNGRGIPPDQDAPAGRRHGGIGRESMRRRMEKIGGSFTWSRRAGGGTVLEFRITLSSAAPA